MKRKKNESLNPPVPSVTPFKSVKEFELGIFVDVDKDEPEHLKYYDPSYPLGTLKNPFKSTAEATKLSEERKLQSKPLSIDATDTSGEIKITGKVFLTDNSARTNIRDLTL
jgi:hypothetical protein